MYATKSTIIVSIDEDLSDTHESSDDREGDEDENPSSDDEGSDVWSVSDNGDDYDDESGLSAPDADQSVEERVDYYRALGHTVIVQRNGIDEA